MNAKEYIQGVLTLPGAGARSDNLEFAGQTMRLEPVTAAAFAEVSVTVGGGAPVDKAIGALDALLGPGSGAVWLPWMGRAAGPPDIPVMAGFPTAAAATATAFDVAAFLGGVPGAAAVTAKLSALGITPGTCGEFAEFARALAGNKGDARALAVAIAAAQAAPAAGDSAELVDARTMARSLAGGLPGLADAISAEAAENVAAAEAKLTGVGFAVGPSHVGDFSGDLSTFIPFFLLGRGTTSHT